MPRSFHFRRLIEWSAIAALICLGVAGIYRFGEATLQFLGGF